MFFDIVTKLSRNDFAFADKELPQFIPHLHYLNAVNTPIELWQRIIPIIPKNYRAEILGKALDARLDSNRAEEFDAIVAFIQKQEDGYFSEILYANGFALFKKACAKGNLPAVRTLIKEAEKLGGMWPKAMLVGEGYDDASHPEMYEIHEGQVMGLARANLMLHSYGGEIRTEKYAAFDKASHGSHIEVLKELITLARKHGVLADIIQDSNYCLFRESCALANTETIHTLLTLAKEAGCLPQMLEAKNCEGFRDACEHSTPETINAIISTARETDKNLPQEMLKAHHYAAFSAACKSKTTDNVKLLMALAKENDSLGKVLNSYTNIDHPEGYKPVVLEVAKLAKAKDDQPLLRELMDAMTEQQWLTLARTETASKSSSPAPSVMREETAAAIQSLNRWQRVAHMNSPHTSLDRSPPYGFKKALYDEVLPAMQLISRVERNKIPETHAYKLAVLFASKEEVKRYLDRFLSDWSKGEVRQPVHDALLFNLPEDGKWTLHKWKDMILRYGPSFSKFLPLAPKIELYLAEHQQPFPVTPVQLSDIAAQVSYERAQENPDFAKLAITCGLDESDFNTCLEILKQKLKTKDILPDIFIDGAEIGHPNYYMEKLKPGDPVGLVLGELTNCCQSIGSTGEACARHGMTSENGGFYVWKHKTKGRRTPQDSIVAQSWAWVGKDDKLVFDSFEKLGKGYSVLCAPFLEQFAHETVNKHTFKDRRILKAVHLGTGGGTPEGFKTIANSASKPTDHNGYSDSVSQYLINPVDHKALNLSENVPLAAGVLARRSGGQPHR